MNQDRLSFNDLLQEENEYREITPLISFLRIDIKQFKRRNGLPIDFAIEYNNKRIGIEVTDIRPYLYNYRISKKATENTVEDIIKNNVIEDTISYFQIDIILKEKTYKTKRLKTKSKFQEEIQQFLKRGKCNNPQYIEYFSKREYSNVNISKDKLLINFQYEGFLNKIPQECIYNAINKKERKLIEYKNLNGEKFDEFWLCIGLPYEEKGYTIIGAELKTDFKSDFQKIFLTQFLPPRVIKLYHKM